MASQVENRPKNMLRDIQKNINKPIETVTSVAVRKKD
jgi:hypothetical protein